MVIQFLGRDLTYYLKTFRKFSLKCVLNIADQMLNILDNVHKKYKFY
jgi:casein kinase 1